MDSKFAALIIFISISYHQACGQKLNCSFSIGHQSVYSCFLKVDNPNGLANFTEITGTHLPEMTNEDVTKVAYGSLKNTTTPPPIVCETFQNPTEVFITETVIKSIKDSFRYCSKLKKIEIYLNNLFQRDSMEIDEDAFVGNPELRLISAWNNRIKSLHENVFRNQNKLMYLWLNNNEISDLGDDIFLPLHNLLQLDLWSNQIKVMKRNWFRNLTKLEDLWIAVNQIESLPPNAFNNMVNLKMLALSANELKELPNNIFSSLKSLKIIYLEHNKLKEIHSESFGYLLNLTHIYLTNNQIDAIDERLINNTGVTYIDMRNNTCANVNITDNSTSRDVMRNALQKCFENYKLLYPDETTTIDTTTDPTFSPGCIDGNLDDRKISNTCRKILKTY
ncbi:unnamed protein product [Chironomus riparius]|uniref:Uncharacterized protein n=1 Tax=Chironomus riparius TaxID=315576 RepID=A0A9N9RLH5_9DIPT|nr:unnamed protein product [Chironomus riparius]